MKQEGTLWKVFFWWSFRGTLVTQHWDLTSLSVLARGCRSLSGMSARKNKNWTDPPFFKANMSSQRRYEASFIDCKGCVSILIPPIFIKYCLRRKRVEDEGSVYSVIINKRLKRRTECSFSGWGGGWLVTHWVNNQSRCSSEGVTIWCLYSSLSWKAALSSPTVSEKYSADCLCDLLFVFCF